MTRAAGLLAAALVAGGGLPVAAEDAGAAPATPSEALRRAHIAAAPWGADRKGAVAARRVGRGFTREQVLLAFGEPDWIAGARWVFLTGAGAGRVLRFEAGEVRQVAPLPADLIPLLRFRLGPQEARARWPALRPRPASGGAVRLERDVHPTPLAIRGSLLVLGDRLVAVNLYLPPQAVDTLAGLLVATFGTQGAGVALEEGGDPRVFRAGRLLVSALPCCTGLPGRPGQAALTVIDVSAYAGGRES